ncbi:unnamed protein product [Echinostoma caproni]|uniref:Uncharacterized protein n=1 Tax=Echinostoma caproni TaxID=27848 RepID=A0A183AIN7_9TREM|nr:unnamed protein product [Echinostoma caproni]
MHSTVESRHQPHQPHPKHHHHPHHHHPHQGHLHQPFISDRRAWHPEEETRHQNGRSPTDASQRVQPHLPPKPTGHVESRLPPTPSRSVAWPPRLTTMPDFSGQQPYWPSQKARAERKHSVYVNAAIYPLREQPQSQNGGDKSETGSPVGTVRRSPPASWTHLLPYRTSTVPQNLSERLKKSETLPNDVWVHAQRTNSIHDPNSQTNSAHPQTGTGNSANVDHQMARQNGTDGTPIGLKSPPPRPPIRTSSQQLSGRMNPSTPSEQRVTRSIPKSNSSTQSPQLRHDPSLSGLFTGDQTSLDDSPILCRYSQLYSLAPKLDSGDRSKLYTKGTQNHSNSPILSRPSIDTPPLPPELHMQRLRIHTDDIS